MDVMKPLMYDMNRAMPMCVLIIIAMAGIMSSLIAASFPVSEDGVDWLGSGLPGHTRSVVEEDHALITSGASRHYHNHSKTNYI